MGTLSYAEIEEVYFIKPQTPQPTPSRVFEIDGLHFILIYIVALFFMVLSK